jgi:protein phosphatase
MNSSSNPDSSSAEVIVRVAGLTDVGRTREHNEDAFVVADLTTGAATAGPHLVSHAAGPKGSLFMVADGMGGAAAGEIASAMAVDIVLGEMRTHWIAADAADAEGFVRAIKQATKTANAQINAFAGQHPEYRGMGTTATIAGFLGDTLYLAQVGDSRAYVVRDGVTRQITKDQSLMQKLIEAGEMTEEEAEHSERQRNLDAARLRARIPTRAASVCSWVQWFLPCWCLDCWHRYGPNQASCRGGISSFPRHLPLLHPSFQHLPPSPPCLHQPH